jgi:hypothetical protein
LGVFGHSKPLEMWRNSTDFQEFYWYSERFSYSPTIVDTHVCTFFDGVLEEMLERKLSVHRRKIHKTQQIIIKK